VGSDRGQSEAAPDARRHKECPDGEEKAMRERAHLLLNKHRQLSVCEKEM